MQIIVEQLACSIFHKTLALLAFFDLALSCLGYPFSEAHGVIPLDVETNYPDIVAIQKQNDENKTDAGYGNVFLEVCLHLACNLLYGFLRLSI